MKDRKGSQFLGPTAMALLQECFEVLLVRYGISRDSEDADVIATALFEAHGSGATDRFELMRLVDIQAALRHIGS